MAGARAAYQLATDSGHAKAAPAAARNLGLLLAEQGDMAGARAAFQSAIDSGHAEAAPAAARNLGVLLANQGDVAGARAAFQLAIDSRHAEGRADTAAQPRDAAAVHSELQQPTASNATRATRIRTPDLAPGPHAPVLPSDA
jgi:Tfp pilus assembly protein PilF